MFHHHLAPISRTLQSYPFLVFPVRAQMGKKKTLLAHPQGLCEEVFIPPNSLGLGPIPFLFPQNGMSYMTDEFGRKNGVWSSVLSFSFLLLAKTTPATDFLQLHLGKYSGLASWGGL